MRTGSVAAALLGLLLGSPCRARPADVPESELDGAWRPSERPAADAAAERARAALLAARREVAQRAAHGGWLADGRSPGRGDSADARGVTSSPDVLFGGSPPSPPASSASRQDPPGASRAGDRWRERKGGGTASYVGAVLFICFIGAIPIFNALVAAQITKTQVVESLLLYVWLFGGLYLFTSVLVFQSVHFESPRTLSVEETAYLYAQLLTTVGYGDITPARPRGQLCLGLFVLCAVLLIAAMVQEMLEFFQNLMDDRLEDMGDCEEDVQDLEGRRASDSSLGEKTPRAEMLKVAFEPVIYSSLVFCCFVALGTAFFTLYPGEEKGLAAAVYMALVSLSTVGFGVYVPETHAGMVVSCWWLLFGCASLMAVITSRAAFSLSLKEHEIRMIERQWKTTGRRVAFTREQRADSVRALRSP